MCESQGFRRRPPAPLFAEPDIVRPLEEALFPLLLTALFALAGGPGAQRLLDIAKAQRWHRALALGLGAAATGLFSFGALGPNFATAPDESAAWALSIGAALITALAGAPALHRSSDETPAAGAPVLALLVGASLLGGAFFLRNAATIEAPHEASPQRARWRLRLRPWDGDAMLALAWAARNDNHADVAEERLSRAEAMGCSPKGKWELRAELAALSGDCDAARSAFDEALRAEAMAAFESGASLQLGGYWLPEALVTECGLRRPQ